jgi:hypothetical protein
VVRLVYPGEEGESRRRLREASEEAGRILGTWGRLPSLVPRSISCAPSETEPAVEVVLEPRPGKARRLPAAWADGPCPVSRAFCAYRTLRDAARKAERDRLGFGPLHPEGVLVYDDGSLLWSDAGLTELLRLCGRGPGRTEPLPWAASPDEWEREAAAAARYELVGLVRSLLTGGPDRPLPAEVAGLEGFFSRALAREAAERPSGLEELDALLGEALRRLELCARCGAPLERGECAQCVPT